MAYTICVIPGDGIGREVVPAAIEVLRATGLDLRFHFAEAGWACFQELGTALPDETIQAVREADATLFGAVSSPTGRRVEGYRSPIVALRREFHLYANLRPARSWPLAGVRPGIDLLIVRENTEDLYVQQEHLEGERAVAERVITRQASERVARAACRLAMGRRRKLTIVHKANILPLTCGLFRDTVRQVADEFPGLEVEEVLVDAMAMRLIRDPESFDVIVTTNMFGDILSDEAAALCGGMGLTPSANLGDAVAVFEPVHGSAPDIAGKGLANPMAAILAASMMLSYLGEAEAAGWLVQGVETALRRRVMTPDLGGQASTAQVTAVIRETVEALAAGLERDALERPAGGGAGHAGETWWAAPHHELECSVGDGLVLEPLPAQGVPRPAAPGRRYLSNSSEDTFRRQAWL